MSKFIGDDLVWSFEIKTNIRMEQSMIIKKVDRKFVLIEENRKKKKEGETYKMWVTEYGEE